VEKLLINTNSAIFALFVLPEKVSTPPSENLVHPPHRQKPCVGSNSFNEPPSSDPLQRVQAQIRHKRFPLPATPIYSVLSLSSSPLRAETSPYFAFDCFARSFLALKIKNKTLG
jgi:hypothetical protein